MPAPAVPWAANRPLDRQIICERTKCRFIQKLDTRNGIGAKAVARQKVCVAFLYHLAAVLVAAVNRRVEHNDAAVPPQASLGLVESRAIIHRVMQRRVVNGEIETRCGKREMVELRFD